MNVPALVVVDVPAADVAVARRLLEAAGAEVRTAADHPHRLVAGAADPDALFGLLRGRHRHDPTARAPHTWAVHLAVVDDSDWADEWRPWLTPHVVEPFLITPPWVDVPDTDHHVLRIDPGPAFGGGAHPSTQHALRLVAETVGPGSSVLDVGTGSGVLAVAAGALGARRIVATDIDPASPEVVAVNAEANRAIIDATTTPVEDLTETFDVVVANIESLVLRQLAPAIAGRAERGGTLVLAGILAGPSESVAAAYRALGWHVVGELAGPDDWRAWRLERR